MNRLRKPKLASGERVKIRDDSGAPRLGTSNVVTIEAPKGEALPRRAFRSVFGLVALLAIVAAATYAALAATVVVVLDAEDNKALVLRNTFPVGGAPEGVIVYASVDEVPTDVGSKLTQAVSGVPAGSVVQIVAGPSASVYTNPEGFIVADGVVTEFTGQVTSRDLTHEYVALCLDGACRDDAAVIVGENNIVGEVKGYLGLDGLSSPNAE